MDIIDIILAKAMTPQGQIETYAARAERAVTAATQALNNINEIVDNFSNIENLQEFTDTEIGKLALSLTNEEVSDAILRNLLVQYPNDEQSTLVGTCTKYYTTTGQNTDGTMTQKAITDAINAMAQNGGGGGNSGGNEPGGDTPISPDQPEQTTNTGILGLRINYNTSTYTPTDNAINATPEDFNTYSMYGGRKRCIVDDNGTIIAFYGDNNYNEDSSNGYQVMVYQPKFYYKRTIIDSASTTFGTTVKEELLQLSAVAKSGFKLHPLFIDDNNNELDYVLLSAYEGSIESSNQSSYKNIQYNDFLTEKLSSVNGAIPITGSNNNMTQINAETLANNRGEEWHIITSKSISAQQMLFMVEYHTLNIQEILGLGLTNFSETSQNSFNITGSTNQIGNSTGRAEMTNINNKSYTADGKVAVSYRGYENPFGSIWQLIGDLLIATDNNKICHYYICNSNNYNLKITNRYNELTFKNGYTNGWISGFGYDNNYDWLYLPNAFNSSASSIAPVGDYYYGMTVNNKTSFCLCGGCWFGTDKNGLFFYNTDRDTDYNASYNVGTRLLYIPNKSKNNYTTNINKWINSMGA